MDDPASPSWAGLAYASAPMLVVMAVLARSRLGLVRRLAIATARLLVQLSALGLVLGYIFSASNPWLVGAIAAGMLAASSQAVVAHRRGRAAGGLRVEAFAAMGLSTAAVLAWAFAASLRPVPWYDPRTVVPIVGMVLGHAVNGVALAADRFDAELRLDRDRIELRLALGATARQAAHPALRAAASAGLTPTIQSMTIAGIVAIPGLMTGQILAGAGVDRALRYQILLYLMISGATGLSVLLLIAMRLRRYFTPDDQLCLGAFSEPP